MSKQQRSDGRLAGLGLWRYGIAAAIILMIGITIGYQINESGQNSRVNKTEMLSFINETSASKRIKGIQLARIIEETDTEMIDILIMVLNTDKNANVRIAAANALFEYRDNDKAISALISSLSNQTDPLVQFSLVKIMFNLDKQRAIEEVNRILEKEDTPEEIREIYQILI